MVRKWLASRAAAPTAGVGIPPTDPCSSEESTNRAGCLRQSRPKRSVMATARHDIAFWGGGIGTSTAGTDARGRSPAEYLSPADAEWRGRPRRSRLLTRRCAPTKTRRSQLRASTQRRKAYADGPPSEKSERAAGASPVVGFGGPIAGAPYPGSPPEAIAAKTCPICGVALRGRQISPCSDRCRATKSRRRREDRDSRFRELVAVLAKAAGLTPEDLG